MNKKRILVLGFSGLVMMNESLGKYFNMSNVSLSIVSLGGCDIRALPFVFPSIILNQKFDYIILEIFKQGFRGTWNNNDEEEFIIPFNDLCNQIISHGAIPIIWALPRTDIDYVYDPLYKCLDLLITNNNHKMIYLDYIKNKDFLIGEDKSRYFIDSTHPSSEGSDYFVKLMYFDLHERLKLNSSFNSISNTSFVSSFKLLQDCNFANNEKYILDRNGFKFVFNSIKENSYIYFEIALGFHICGLFFINGPLSGDLLIETSQDSFLLHTNDAHSYYERFDFSYFDKKDSRIVKIIQLPTRFEIDLVKGVDNNSPRIGYVGGLLTVNDC